jgi:hypothetical protein
MAALRETRLFHAGVVGCCKAHDSERKYGRKHYIVKGKVQIGDLDLDELTRRGSSITLNVTSIAGRVGTLTVGRGSLTWKHRKTRKTMTWWEFSEHMLKN